MSSSETEREVGAAAASPDAPATSSDAERENSGDDARRRTTGDTAREEAPPSGEEDEREAAPSGGEEDEKEAAPSGGEEDQKEAAPSGGEDDEKEADERDEANEKEASPPSEVDDVNEGEIAQATLQAAGRFAIILNLLSPLFIALNKIVPDAIKDPILIGWYWIITHKAIVTIVFAVVFTLLLFLIPDAYLPQLDTEKTASIIVKEYCNRSQIEDLLNAPNDDFGSQVGQDLPPLNTEYLEGLASYACNLPKREVLLLWAPPGYGMDSGLHQMATVWKGQGRVVVHIELKDFRGERGELPKIILQAVLEAFKDHDLSMETIQGLEALLDRTSGGEEEEDEVDVKETSLFALIRQLTLKAVGFVPLVSQQLQKKLLAFYDTKLSNLNTYLDSLVRSDAGILGEINFRTLFSAMQILTRYQPQLAPVVIFDHMEVLSKFEGAKGATFVDRLVKLLLKHEEDVNVVPVILATRDTLWFYKTGVFEKPGLFIPYKVEEVSEEEGARLLVRTLNIWTEEEFRKIYAAVGGHSRSISEIFRYSKFFLQSVDRAIESEAEYSDTELSSAIAQANKLGSGTEKFLSQLRDSDYTLALEKVEEVTRGVESLIQSGVLYIDSGLVVKPVSTGMQRAVDRYLTKAESNK